MSDEKPKRELTEAELEQRRNAARQPKTMTEAALEQRRAASQNSTGPITPEGKAASSRNNWRTGEYSAISKADAWQRLVLSSARPCKSTCERYPCSLVDEGVTQPGQDCLDKQIFVEAFDSIMMTLATGDAAHSHGLLGVQMAGAIEILNKLREEIAKAVIVYKPLVNKAGDTVGEVPMSNPVLGAYIEMLGKLGINLPELMATPKAVLSKKQAEDEVDAFGEMFGRLIHAAGGARRARTIEGEVE